MRIKLDENLPAELADDLWACGHDADTVVGEHLAGEPDAIVAEAAPACAARFSRPCPSSLGIDPWQVDSS